MHVINLSKQSQHPTSQVSARLLCVASSSACGAGFPVGFTILEVKTNWMKPIWPRSDSDEATLPVWDGFMFATSGSSAACWVLIKLRAGTQAPVWKGWRLIEYDIDYLNLQAQQTLGSTYITTITTTAYLTSPSERQGIWTDIIVGSVRVFIPYFQVHLEPIMRQLWPYVVQCD